MNPPARIAGLVIGLLVLDLLLDLPGFIAAPSAFSLLAPSLDLLVVSAILAVGARPGEGGRGVLRVVAAAALLLFAVYDAGTRFGVAELLRPLSLLAIAAAAAVAWLSARLVLGGFQTGLARSVFIIVVAAAALLQVVTGNRVLAPSVVPRMARDIAALFG